MEALDKIDEESAREDWERWGQTDPTQGPSTDLFNSPKFQELVHVLLQNPILVAPALNFVKLKQAQMARAQLETLYTPEQLEEMYNNLDEQ